MLRSDGESVVDDHGVPRARVSAIVTTRNSGGSLEKCLSSIRKQTYTDVELIVIDNNSTDSTQEIARRYADRWEVGGPERSAQRNLGARLASGSLLLFLDADMELTAGVIGDCVRLSGSYDALIVPEKSVGRGWLVRARAIERGTYTGSFIFEAARFVTKAAFIAVGGYDTSLTGPEDYDFEANLERSGLRVGHSTVPILHHEGENGLGQHLRKRTYYADSLRGYVKKHPDRARIQFGPRRIEHYLRKLGSSPFRLTTVLVLKGMEYAATFVTMPSRRSSKEEIYSGERPS